MQPDEPREKRTATADEETATTGPGSVETTLTTGNPAAGAGVDPEQGRYHDQGVGRREDVRRREQ